MKASATAEAIAPYLRWGNGAYMILCSTNGCYSEEAVSVGKHASGKPKYRLKAAENLAKQGWTCPEQPLCPDCSREGEVNG